jgi:hypothetical protein
VSALTVFDDGHGAALYAGGSFATAGGVSANHVARWDGTSWSALGRGTDAAVKTLAVFDDGSGPALYAGGAFFAAGSVAANRIAKWNGTRWSNVGDAAFGLNGIVVALQPFDDGGVPILFAGGAFAQFDAVEVDSIARWDGSEWTAIGRAPNDAVAALIEFDDGGGAALYATGQFQSVDGIPASGIGKWDGSSWSPLGRGIGGSYGILIGAPPTSGNALAVYDDGGGPALYVGGTFRTAGNVVANRIAKWNGASWSALGSGMTPAPIACCATVDALAVFDDGGGPALYAGGFFDAAGGVPAHSLAKWDGTSWSALATELDTSGLAEVYSLTVFDDGSGRALYVGGRFFNAGGSGANYVAKWDGASWSRLGAGTDEVVRTLAALDDGGGPALFAGGRFTSAGSVAASHVAKWNGTQWSALGGGTDDSVFAITAFDDGNGAALCVGGSFTNAGGISANRIAKWNGSSWSALGRGVNDTVSAARVFDDGRAPALYVGGHFTTSFDSGDSFVAKWACDPTPP